MKYFQYIELNNLKLFKFISLVSLLTLVWLLANLKFHMSFTPSFGQAVLA